jgi:hypothetical protein
MRLWSSPDLVTWTKLLDGDLISMGSISKVREVGGIVVANAGTQRIMVSSDGVTFQQSGAQSDTVTGHAVLLHTGSRWIAAGGGGQLLHATNPFLPWTVGPDLPVMDNAMSGAVGPDGLVVIGGMNGRLVTSPDGVTPFTGRLTRWSSRDTYHISTILYSASRTVIDPIGQEFNGVYLAATYRVDGSTAYSGDGITWWHGTDIAGQFVAVAEGES